jgi:transcriptional regulator with GAF, ATPase, and Fis domain
MSKSEMRDHPEPVSAEDDLSRLRNWEPSDQRRPAMTANQARSLGQQELFDRLEALLVETRGNIAEVARRLGKDRSTVRYHLQRFGMLGDRGAPPSVASPAQNEKTTSHSEP